MFIEEPDVCGVGSAGDAEAAGLVADAAEAVDVPIPVAGAAGAAGADDGTAVGVALTKDKILSGSPRISTIRSRTAVSEIGLPFL